MNSLQYIWSSLKQEDNKLPIFFLITFGLPLLMGIVMGFAFYQGSDVTSFAGTQMFYPAAGTMLAYLCSKNMKELIPVRFFYFFILITLLLILMTLITAISGNNWSLLHEVIVVLASLVSYYLLAHSDTGQLVKAGLSFRIHWKESLGYILLFAVLYFVGGFLSGVLTNDFAFDSPKYGVVGFVLLPFSFFLAYLPFLGEEYGWRFFLQPILQRKYGYRKGIILLGVLWGIWHLPLNLFYYSPDTCLQSILVQIISCICLSVFIGYVYMKTKNVWAVSVIHYLNNGFVGLLSETNGENVIISWYDVLIILIVYSVVYLPFLFAKVYRVGNETVLIEEKEV